MGHYASDVEKSTAHQHSRAHLPNTCNACIHLKRIQTLNWFRSHLGHEVAIASAGNIYIIVISLVMITRIIQYVRYSATPIQLSSYLGADGENNQPLWYKGL